MTLHSLKQALSLELSSDTAFRFVNTRLILRTGVDLTRSDQEMDEARLQLVTKELQAMGCLKGFPHE